MLKAAPELHLPPRQDNRDRWIAFGVAVSLLLHLLFAWLLYLQPWAAGVKLAETPLEIEMVLPPPPPARTPPPPAAAPPPAVAPPPEPSQLQRAPLAEQSTVPSPKAQAEAPKPVPRQTPAPAPLPSPQGQAEAPKPAPRPQAPAAPQRPLSRDEAQALVQTAPEMRQSEQDFFLAQIATNWIIDRQAPQFADVQVTGSYVVLPNGMLAPPFGKNDPWDMSAMIRNWEQILRARGAESYRISAETFMRAMRLAQPLQLPPNFGDKPKRMTLNLRIGDLP